MRKRRFVYTLPLAAATLCVGLGACGESNTDLAALRALRVEGRVYDVATDIWTDVTSPAVSASMLRDPRSTRRCSRIKPGSGATPPP